MTDLEAFREFFKKMGVPFDLERLGRVIDLPGEHLDFDADGKFIGVFDFDLEEHLHKRLPAPEGG